MGCPPRTYKADIEASPGIAEKARAWMAEQGDERIFAFSLIRKSGWIRIGCKPAFRCRRRGRES
ncbi:MAG: hypothetical protein F4X64_00225 [Chloroflexi bacterium]|nr:hypothetical protein [Chloroflexota bacterium]